MLCSTYFPRANYTLTITKVNGNTIHKSIKRNLKCSCILFFCLKKKYCLLHILNWVMALTHEMMVKNKSIRSGFIDFSIFYDYISKRLSFHKFKCMMYPWKHNNVLSWQLTHNKLFFNSHAKMVTVLLIWPFNKKCYILSDTQNFLFLDRN